MKWLKDTTKENFILQLVEKQNFSACVVIFPSLQASLEYRSSAPESGLNARYPSLHSNKHETFALSLFEASEGLMLWHSRENHLLYCSAYRYDNSKHNTLCFFRFSCVCSTENCYSLTTSVQKHKISETQLEWYLSMNRHAQAIKLFKINCKKQLLISDNDYSTQGLLSEHWSKIHQTWCSFGWTQRPDFSEVIRVHSCSWCVSYSQIFR